MRRLSAVALIFLILFPRVSSAQADSPGGAAGCTPAARLFGETICDESLVPEGFTPEMLARIPEGEQGQAIRNSLDVRKTEALRKEIWKRGLAHRFGAEAIALSDEEIEDFQGSLKATLDNDYNRDRTAAAYVRSVLQKNKYAPEYEKKLRDILEASEASMRFYEQRESHIVGMPEQYKFVTDEASKKVAAMVLAEWKENKVLYENFGGQLFLTPMGVVPLEARRRLLDYIRKDGSLDVLKAAYKDVLAPLDAETSSPDSKPLRPEQAKRWAEQNMSSPGGAQSVLSRYNGFEKLKKEIDSLPTLGAE